MAWTEIAPVADFTLDGGECVKVDGKHIAIFNMKNKTEWYAIQNTCPHDNSSVLSGAGTGRTVALWEGPSSVTDSDTLGNAPITFNGNNATFAGNVTIAESAPTLTLQRIGGSNVDPCGTIVFKENKDDWRKAEIVVTTIQSISFPLGYKHMCHFWSMDFLDYLSDYKYIIRIDEDCFVTKFAVLPVNFSSSFNHT